MVPLIFTILKNIYFQLWFLYKSDSHNSSAGKYLFSILIFYHMFLLKHTQLVFYLNDAKKIRDTDPVLNRIFILRFSV